MHNLLAILLTALLFLIVASSDESVIEMLDETWVADFFHALHIGNSIVFGLAISFFTSVISWMVFVYFPEQKRKRIAKKRLSKSYQHFKESVIRNLLGILEVPGIDIPPEEFFYDYREFRKFFDDNGGLWGDILSGLDGDAEKFNDVWLDIDLLIMEIRHVLYSIEIRNEEVNSRFNNFIRAAYNLKNRSYLKADSVKYLDWFLWEELAQESVATGHVEKGFPDIINLI